jgi:hypothetical protein
VYVIENDSGPAGELLSKPTANMRIWKRRWLTGRSI